MSFSQLHSTELTCLQQIVFVSLYLSLNVCVCLNFVPTYAAVLTAVQRLFDVSRVFDGGDGRNKWHIRRSRRWCAICNWRTTDDWNRSCSMMCFLLIHVLSIQIFYLAQNIVPRLNCLCVCTLFSVSFSFLSVCHFYAWIFNDDKKHAR